MCCRTGATRNRRGIESNHAYRHHASGQLLARELARYRPLRWLREPATLDGGDVMHAGSTLYVGASQRTNAEGIRQLAAELEPLRNRP
jgi:arginine deiminase